MDIGTTPSFLMNNPVPSYPVDEWTSKAWSIILQANLGYDTFDDLIWFLSEGAATGVLAEYEFTDVRELTYRELDGMPTKSSCASHSQIIMGTNKDGKRILMYVNSFLEGLHPTESYFLVRLSKNLGIKSVKFVVEASSTGRNEGLKEGQTVIVRDHVNKTYFPAVEPTQIHYPYRNLTHQLNTQYAGELKNDGSDYEGEQPTLIGFDGPFLPTNMNVSMGKEFGIDLYTISNLSVIDQSATNDLIHTVFARVTGSDFKGSKEPDTKLGKLLFETLLPAQDLKEKIASLDAPIQAHRELVQKMRKNDELAKFEEAAPSTQDE